MYVPEELFYIFLGIISGVLTAIVIFVFNTVRKKAILPYIEQLLYKGVDISGEWTHTKDEKIDLSEIIESIKNLPEEAKKIPEKKLKEILEIKEEGTITDSKISSNFEITLNIKQKAHRISGKFRAKYIQNKKEYVNHYKIIGEIKDNYVTFNYNAENNDRTGTGSFILRVAKGGTKLIGSAIFTPDANIEDTRISVRENMDFKKN